jgi:hypothetical protein
MKKEEGSRKKEEGRWMKNEEEEQGNRRGREMEEAEGRRRREKEEAYSLHSLFLFFILYSLLLIVRLKLR